jgi:hypothetical protein
VFIVDNKQFFAQKSILSVRSKVFEDMFANDMIESHSNKCTIHDIQSEVFEQFFTFIYTGKSPKAQSMAHKLLAAAEKYEILELKDICEDLVFIDLTVVNAIQSLKIADIINANKILKPLNSLLLIFRLFAKSLVLYGKHLSLKIQKLILKSSKLLPKKFQWFEKHSQI